MTHPRLTERQAEVLRARCETGSRKAAGEQLGLTAQGVRWHLDRAFEQCGCRDEAEACFRHHEELVAALQTE